MVPTRTEQLKKIRPQLLDDTIVLVYLQGTRNPDWWPIFEPTILGLSRFGFAGRVRNPQRSIPGLVTRHLHIDWHIRPRRQCMNHTGHKYSFNWASSKHDFRHGSGEQYCKCELGEGVGLPDVPLKWCVFKRIGNAVCTWLIKLAGSLKRLNSALAKQDLAGLIRIVYKSFFSRPWSSIVFVHASYISSDFRLCVVPKIKPSYWHFGRYRCWEGGII